MNVTKAVQDVLAERERQKAKGFTTTRDDFYESDMAVQLTNAESKCRELAAENAEMRSSIDATIGWQESTDPENGESVRMLVDIKTPATDAFLAEVRAQGVEMFVSHMDHPHRPYEFTHGYMDRHAIEFAAKLRQEAAL